MNQKQVSVSFMLMGILFCVCLVASNMLETKVVQLGPVSLTAGFLVFPISYIINDCIAEVWGFKKARLIIWMGFMMNFFVALMGLLAVALPATSYWSANEPHFNFVFSLAPRVTIASFLAFLVGSFLNAYVMSKMKLAMEGKHFSWRAVVSTLVGEGADSLIFFPLAFAGLMPFNEVIKLMVIQVVAKTLYEIIALPLTIRVVKKVKEIEGTDVYDKDISYNILKLKDL
ncbi:MAG: queuosine precursor transporter [Bacteroidaceae bacterium]|nr:queuosine precursor transporter [Bacteroidaceae bacterium]